MSHVSCLSSDTTLQACDSEDTAGCTHNFDIGLNCSNCSQFLCDDSQCVNGTQCDGIMQCEDGSDEDALICGKLC